MAPVKRKRPHDDAVPEPRALSPMTRRATRQTSAAPLHVQLDPEPKRRRRRPANTEPEKMQTNGVPAFTKNIDILAAPKRCREKENIPLPPVHSGPLKPTRGSRHGRAQIGMTSRSFTDSSSIDNAKSSTGGGPAPPLTGSPAQSAMQPANPRKRRARPSDSNPQPPISRPEPAPGGTATPQRQQKLDKGMAAKTPNGRPDRNIDKVVLGDICFRAWYPSYYGKEVLGDISANSTKGTGISAGHGLNTEEGGWKAQGRRDKDRPPMLDRLYVCPCCFKYSKELVAWWEHVRVCEATYTLPGKKIYVHPKGRRKILVPATTGPRVGRAKRGGKMIEGMVQDEGEWSIWEVDGDKDVLFCQNLSLFAKLFLDNKSVFFDVTGFNYFLLVYTPASPPSNPDTGASGATQPRSQVVGFFSKEKLSWDNNNLACILIFPPWQRKGLGSLLMGISYEISRREGVLGGPEKPISDLGKRGYKRFWAGEIARWLLSLDTGGDGAEAVVDAEACSMATWIAPEDCVITLREMGIVEDAGKAPVPGPESSEEAEAGEGEKQEVQRVRISKEAVRLWVTANGISLDRACDPEGFVEGYALKSEPAEEDS